MGAASYLAQSVYGRNGTGTETDIVAPNLSNYNTGAGNYKTNVTMSTTGNVYGIYDLAGGAWEHTAAYVDVAEKSYLTNPGRALYEAAAKYKDVYVVSEAGDDKLRNYSANVNKYGDGIFETSYTSYDGASYANSSWYQDHSDFPFDSSPFFYCGGGLDNGGNPGIFAFGANTGVDTTYGGFRVSIATP